MSGFSPAGCAETQLRRGFSSLLLSIRCIRRRCENIRDAAHGSCRCESLADLADRRAEHFQWRYQHPSPAANLACDAAAKQPAIVVLLCGEQTQPVGITGVPSGTAREQQQIPVEARGSRHVGQQRTVRPLGSRETKSSSARAAGGHRGPEHQSANATRQFDRWCRAENATRGPCVSGFSQRSFEPFDTRTSPRMRSATILG